jgi:hypothetical protein
MRRRLFFCIRYILEKRLAFSTLRFRAQAVDASGTQRGV